MSQNDSSVCFQSPKHSETNLKYTILSAGSVYNESLGKQAADLEGGNIAAIGRNISSFVQQVLSRDPHVIKHGKSKTGTSKS